MSSESQSSPPPQASPPGRWARTAAGFAGGLVGFVAIGWGLVWALDALDQQYSRVELDVVTVLTQMLDKRRDTEHPDRLVYLGDSLSMTAKGDGVAAELRRLLRLEKDTNGPAEVFNVSLPGLTGFSHYFISEALTQISANRFVVAVNLGWFDRGKSAQQPSLVGMLPIRRWPEAVALPLHEIGLSADEIVLSHALMTTDQLERWHFVQREQVRFRRAVARTIDAFQAALGAPGGERYVAKVRQHLQRQRRKARRPTYEGARKRLGSVLDGLPPDNPTLLVVDVLVRRLREEGARVLVLVPPTNVEALRDVGAFDPDGLAISLARIREVAIRNGADFLDLHALLPDDSFFDQNDHLEHGAEIRPAAQVAYRVALWSVDAEQWNDPAWRQPISQ